jgi:hypothetical protein
MNFHPQKWLFSSVQNRKHTKTLKNAEWHKGIPWHRNCNNKRMLSAKLVPFLFFQNKVFQEIFKLKLISDAISTGSTKLAIR